jgi:hypothetical protein
MWHAGCYEDQFCQQTDNTGVPWTYIGPVQKGQQEEEALHLFCDTRRAGLSPDKTTFSSIIKAHSSLTMIGLGRKLKLNYLIRSGHMSSLFTGRSLLGMYTKFDQELVHKILYSSSR